MKIISIQKKGFNTINVVNEDVKSYIGKKCSALFNDGTIREGVVLHEAYWLTGYYIFECGKGHHFGVGVDCEIIYK